MFPNILSKNECLVSWFGADIQNFLYNKALRFYLEGSGIFLNLNLSRYKELKIGVRPGWLVEGTRKMQKIKMQKTCFFEVMGVSAACGSIRLVKAL